MMRALYSIVVGLLLPAAFARLWHKGRQNPAYRQRWSERLGRVPRLVDQPRLWIHAVSVGETIAAAPLVRLWQQRHPDWSILVTTTTPTGSAQVKQLFGSSVAHCYLPFDLGWCIGPFLERCRPRLAIIMETEIWPNLYAAVAARGIPLMVANARLSAKSARAYGRLRWLIAPTLARATWIACRGEEDRQRFVALGAPVDRVVPLGNLKFDLTVPADADRNGRAWRQAWGPQRPVWIAASTHPGEEALVLAAHRTILATHPTALLVLVPRHPERAPDIVQQVKDCHLVPVLRTQHPPPGPSSPSAEPTEGSVFIVDTLGELMSFYAASDLAFVGGSLVPHGGHNPLEPLALGKPVITGPHVFNFSELYAELDARDGAVTVDSPTTLAQALLKAFAAPQALPQGVRDWLRASQGSTHRLVLQAEQSVGLNAPPALPEHRA